MAAPIFDNIPEELTRSQQWCIRVGKRPFVHGGQPQSFTGSGWETGGWMTFAEATTALQKGVKVFHDEKLQPVTGIGIIIARSSPEANRPLGGDLDCCRNPETGNISPWARELLQAIQPFYTEVSLSQTGIRFFAWGHLPDEVGSVFGHGPQDDLGEDDREAILTAKPDARKKLELGKPAFNGLEIYETGRHLAITGDKLVEYCYSSEDRTNTLAEALKPYLGEPAEEPPIKKPSAKKAGSFPKLNILQVIDTKGFTESGGQLSGSHPTEGSTTGVNLVVNSGKGIWAYMHDKPAGSAPGGDAWVWLACECGAVPWEKAGAGVLADPIVIAKTMMHAANRGLIPETPDIVAAFRRSMVGKKPEASEEIDLKDLAEKIKADPGVVYEPKTFDALKEIFHSSPLEWERVKKIFRTAKVSIRDWIKVLDEDQEDIPLIERPFMELDHGKLAEMVVRKGVAKFAVYDPATKKIEYVAEIMGADGSRTIPPFRDEIFLKGYVTLPSEAEEYGDEIALYNDIKACVHKYLEVSEDYESIACFYPMLTWVYDVMSVIAYLRAKGDWGVGKSRFMDVFRALCYRSVSTTGAMSEAPIFRIMDKWTGTMIMDEGDLGKSRDAAAGMEKILNCGFERGKPIIRCNPNNPEEVNVFDPFGPKIIATRYEFRDKALESRCFTEIMKEAHRPEVPIELPPEFYEETLHLRNKLLMYRFRNRAKIKERSERGDIPLNVKGLPKRIQQAARPISVILADHPDLLAKLKTFMELKAKALVSEASETTEGYLVRVLEGMVTTLSEDKKKLVWDTGFGSVIEFIKTASGNYKLTVALVRSRANSLGFKTEKSMIQGEQKRRITCEISVFESLKKRYIPQLDDVDDVDDLDDEEGPGKEMRAEDLTEGKNPVNRILTSGGDIDRPDRPDCPPGSSIEAQLQRGEEEQAAKEAHYAEHAAKHSKSKFNRTSDKKIEWAKWTWNPYHGCLGHGCLDYCYARDIAEELYSEKFEPKFEPLRLDAPENTKVPEAAKTDIGEKNVFVCSMGDLFGDWVPQDWIDQIIAKCRKNPQWNFLFLTKNPKRMIGIDWPQNCWVGTTVEVQARVGAAEEAFRQIKAAVKFLSCEPLSEHVVFDDLSMFDWLIIGRRSKTKRLPAMQPKWEWVESIVEQGRKANLKIYQKPELEVPAGYTRFKEYPTPETAKKPAEEDPGLRQFKANMAKRRCCLCGRSFSYDLTPYYDKGVSGHICVTCHMGGRPPEPAKADSQTALDGGEAPA